MQKLAVDLKGVPQTLLLPLLGRAYFTKKQNSLLQDPHAVHIADSLNYNFDALKTKIGGEGTLIWWIARAYHFDHAIKNFLKTHPDGVVVNLGAGLETAFYRVDNGALTWVDLDMPEVIALRRQLIPAHERVHTIAKSLHDYSWMDDVAKLGKDFFFFAGGVFMYFTAEQVKQLFIAMSEKFPQAELMFDSLSAKGPEYANKMLKSANMDDAKLQWGIDSDNVLEGWSDNIKVIEFFPYFKNIKGKKDFSLPIKFKMALLDFIDKAGLYRIHYLEKKQR